LKGFNLTTVFCDVEGSEVSRATTIQSVIPQGQNVTFLHNSTLCINNLAEHDSNYIFDDSNLTCTVIAGLNFAELLPTQLSANVTFPWGAPFYNLQLGTPRFSGGNKTHTTGKVPLSYENHAAFDVIGTLKVRLYSSDGVMLAETEKAVNSAKNTSYSGSLYFSVPLTAVRSVSNSSGHFEVSFSTSMFDCGPMVFPYG
jgi:hypothetical protein